MSLSQKKSQPKPNLAADTAVYCLLMGWVAGMLTWMYISLIIG